MSMEMSIILKSIFGWRENVKESAGYKLINECGWGI